MLPRRAATRLLAALACLLVTGCGAGLITGAVASSNNRQPPPPARVPELSLPETRIPLVPASGTTATSRAVVVSNLQLPSNARLSVQLRALGVAAEQGAPVIVSGQGGSTVVGFTLRLQELVAAMGDPTARDVDGRLAVLVDGVEVATPVPVLLLRQPVASLVPPPGQQHLFLSPLGGTQALLQVNGLRSARASDLQMLVTTADPSGNTAGITRPCTNLAIIAQQGDSVQVAANVPGNTFPGQASLVVEDVIAGRSTVVGDALFRPDVALALPARGPTTGGSLVTLIGSALVPLDFAVPPARPAFDRVQLLFRKGGREVPLAPADLRVADSALERLVFTMPGSPDGRPGQVDVVLRVQLGTVTAEVISPDVFLFANPQPVFGPRGAALDRAPVAAVPIALESAPNGHDAPDFAVLYDEGGTAFLQLLMAQENGMFIRFGAPRRLGDPEIPSERQPRALCAGDFDGDHVPDLISINAGAAVATHQLVLGRSAPNPPLGQVFRFTGDPGTKQCRAADLDGDGVQDLLLLPGVGAPSGLRPQAYLARPVAQGTPNLVRVADVPVRVGPYDACELADLDGDGVLDVAVLTGGTAMRLDVAYGNGNGSFTAAAPLDLQVPGYTPDTASPAVGVHVCGTALPRSLAVVLHGVTGNPFTNPVVVVLQPLPSRGYAQPVLADVLVVPTGPVATSLGADLFGDGTAELVLGSADDTNPARMGVFNWQNSHFVIGDVVDDNSGELLSIASLHFGTAFPADPRTGRAAVPAVFVVHESLIDGVRERRLSTMLVARSPTLLRPTAGGRVDANVLQLVGGNFIRRTTAAVGDTKDLALAYRKLDALGHVIDEGVQLLANDGFGGFFGQRPGPRQLGIVHTTLTRVAPLPAVPDLEVLAWLTIDGRLNLWQPDGNVLLATSDLRQLSPLLALRTSDVAAASRLRSADVDGDGIADLVVQMKFVRPALAEGEALLLVLRGKASYAAGEMPFIEPLLATQTHGSASALVLADFVPEPAGEPRLLECAVAVPTGSVPGGSDGDHVRFYRYDRATRSLRRSFLAGGPQVLLAGNAPTELAAADFDGDGTIDLMVAAAGDASLWLFLHDGTAVGDGTEVDVSAFHESLTSPRAMAPGLPKYLRLGDIDGDGNVDVLVSTETIAAGGAVNDTVGFYLSSGAGQLDGPVFVSAARLGTGQRGIAIDLVDLNGDGVLDLGVAVDENDLLNRNIRILFGGSR